jgi:large subunit ribosomal protein L30
MTTGTGHERRLRIRWVRSAIGHPERVRQTLRGLGLRRLGQVVERPDTPAIRGMIARVRHLVEVGEVNGQ